MGRLTLHQKNRRFCAQEGEDDGTSLIGIQFLLRTQDISQVMMKFQMFCYQMNECSFHIAFAHIDFTYVNIYGMAEMPSVPTHKHKLYTCFHGWIARITRLHSWIHIALGD